MQVPRIMRRINRAVTNPLMRVVAGRVPPLAIVVHRGRKSGRTYRTPVLVFSTDEGFVTPLPYGIDTDWCLNVLAARGCTLESGGKTVRVSGARRIGADEALPLLPAVLRPLLGAADLPGYLRLTVAARRSRRR